MSKRYVVEFDWAFLIQTGEEKRVGRIYEMGTPDGFPTKRQKPAVQLIAPTDTELARLLTHWFENPAAFEEAKAAAK